MASATLPRSNPVVIPLSAHPRRLCYCLKEANGIVSRQTLTSLERQNGSRTNSLPHPPGIFFFSFSFMLGGWGDAPSAPQQRCG